MSNEELLQIKKLLIDDAVKALEMQNEVHKNQIMELVTPAVAKVDGLYTRVAALERDRGLVIRGAIVYSTIVSALIGAGLNWLKSKIFH